VAAANILGYQPKSNGELLKHRGNGTNDGPHPWTIRALIRDGKLARVKIGRRVLVDGLGRMRVRVWGRTHE
jgi:hypothetical protein